MKDDIAIVVIGRNEGERLRSCLASLPIAKCVYVDSGSTDGSVAVARELSFPVVELTSPPGFTAARARNAGAHFVAQEWPTVGFVQMIDGDCDLEPGWLEAARNALQSQPRLACVFGRRRERNPRASIYNLLCDSEWHVPPGPARSCGGDAMFKIDAFKEVKGFSPDLVAGEEPDLCLRLRNNGWEIFNIDAPMTVHDVALLRFAPWWVRAKRTGYAIAELAYRHGYSADPSWWRLLTSAAGWSLVAVSSVLCLLLSPMAEDPTPFFAGILLGAILLGKLALLVKRRLAEGSRLMEAGSWAYLIMVAKLAQSQGLVQFIWFRLKRKKSEIIEYKN